MPFITLATAADAVPADRHAEMLLAVRSAVAAAESPTMRLDSVALQWDELDADRLVGIVAVATVKVLAESTTSEMRRRMLADVSAALIDVVGEERRGGVWVAVEESVHHAEWFGGGRPVTYAVLDRQRAGAEDPFE